MDDVDEHGYPRGFFDRSDPTDDTAFYAYDRFVTHIDEGAIAAVGELYDELGIEGDVLDLMSSWISHFRTAPRHLVVLGMNERELAANPHAAAHVVHDLNADPTLPFDDATFDDVVCCVSVDYLVRPIEVFREVARVLRPGGRFVLTFSNRCFPTKAIRGWLFTDDDGRVAIVRSYFERAGGFTAVTSALRTSLADRGDPLYAVWAARAPSIRFRPLTRDDFPALARWLDEPHIARWWNEPSGLGDLEQRYGPRIDGTDPTEMFVVVVDGTDAGLIQRYRHADHPEHDAAVGIPDAVGIDYFLGADHASRGVGPVMLRAFALDSFDRYPSARWCVATPARANRASWRALEKAGFVRVNECEPPNEPPAYGYGLERSERSPR